MGHERVGALPRSNQWRAIVHDLAGASASQEALANVATATLDNVRDRFTGLEEDPGVQAALGFLVGLTEAHLPTAGTTLVPQIDLSGDPSAFELARRLADWVGARADSHEYSGLATRAAADAIGYWMRRESQQQALFRTQSQTSDVWQRAASGAAFSDIARVFFGKFTERYLNYFLEREASAAIPSLRERDVFATRLQRHLDAVAHHAFETTKIAQSFAAGWYNKNVYRTRFLGQADGLIMPPSG